MASPTASTIWKTALLTLTASLALGCTTGMGIRVKYEPLAKAAYPPTVPLLHEAPPAGRKHTALGYITVSGDNTTTLDELRAAMRLQACDIGADAVYSLTRSESSRELWTASNPRDKEYVISPVLSGLAVRFDSPAGQSPGGTSGQGLTTQPPPAPEVAAPTP